jgi:tetratricopeptide (TPR) repeat protein
MRTRWILTAVAAACIVNGTAHLQEATPEATEQAQVSTAPLFLPDTIRLTGLRPVYQLVNRCSAAALTIQLSYFQWPGTYDDVIRGLNPHQEDVAVRLDEMADFARAQGLGAIERTGGTLQRLRELVAGGFPVLIENSYYEGPGGFDAWLSHNRVIMGYDDSTASLLSFDSLLGNGPDNTGRPIPYDDIDTRWKPFNRNFLVLYRPEQEVLLQQILGEDWDVQVNAENTLEQSQAEVGTPNEDSFTWFNIGSSLLTLNRDEEAAAAFDTALATGLPWRMMWYQYGPLEAYARVGRYDDVIRLATQVLSTTPGVEEIYYYFGRAYEGQGDLQRARGNYQAALFRNEYFRAAQEALARVDALLAPTASAPEAGSP